MDEGEIKDFITKKNFNFFEIHQKTDNAELDEFIKNCINSNIDSRYTAKEALNIIEKIKIQ